MLEVIDKGFCTESHPVPLVFVHGGFHGAWCWDEHFLDFFADKGYRALALSLRGHGASSETKPLNDCSIADYVDDVASIADRLPAPPVVIGHSMGGFIVQKYLESHEAPAAVLMGSVPPSGSSRQIRRFTVRHPWLQARALVTHRSSHCFKTPKRARYWLFSPGTPEPDVTRFAARIQEESARAISGMLRNLPQPQHITSPVLVMGGEHDGSVTRDEMRATALAYRTEEEVFPGMGHNMMLEPGWAAVAERIHSWLENNT